ncbi:MAG: efflux RND transporter periplasmic adaptor subunit [Treponema sp.]|jgi:multidrug efflux pump subunit AcrA (membrane-fusion protein)|nr:efflux RND transporter periplasmic adaptor subunit [Treponema sp.]
MNQERNVKKSRSRAVVTAVIVILIVIFAGLTAYSFFWPKLAPAAGAMAAVPGQGSPGGAPGGPGSGGGQAGNAQGARNATIVRTTEVVLGTIENSVVINGDVLAAGQVTIYPTVAGKLTDLRFRVGDRVGRGQVVAMVDPSRPGEVFSQSPVTSTISGTVLQAPLHTGDTVSTGTAVYVIGDLSVLEVETFVPERYANAARRGLAALVSLEALPGESFPAAVSEVSPVLDPASRTLRIRLRFDRPDERVRAGMFATISLVTNSRRDVPVIPRASVINTYGSWIVFVVDGDNIARRKVISLGLENETAIEVLNGIETGDRVVSAGQNFLSDGDPVRVVEG